MGTKKSEPSFAVQSEVTLSLRALRSIIITAVEGGIGYWAQVKKWPPRGSFRDADEIDDVPVEEIVLYELDESKSDSYDYDRPLRLDLTKLAAAVVEVARKRGYTGDPEEWPGSFDSIDADVAFQLALLGEVRYG